MHCIPQGLQSQYVLCDVIGTSTVGYDESGDHRETWKEVCIRIINDNERLPDAAGLLETS